MSFETLINQIAEMPVAQLAEFVKALETHFGVSAAMPVAGSASAAAATENKASEKAEYKVMLKAAGDKKIDIIKALRKIVPNLGMGEAKTMAESAPAVVAETMPKDKALEAKKLLEEAGATVELL